jgi:hypothetical protein
MVCISHLGTLRSSTQTRARCTTAEDHAVLTEFAITQNAYVATILDARTEQGSQEDTRTGSTATEETMIPLGLILLRHDESNEKLFESVSTMR